MKLSIGRRTGAFVLPSLSAVLFVLPLLLPITLHAQSLPAPKEFYFDEDSTTARQLILVEGNDEATQQRLVKAMNGRGRDADLATAQLAHIAYASGRTELGDTLYKRVIAAVGASHSLSRSLLWNRGWDLYHAGDTEHALENWRDAMTGNPSWVPPTLALGLWTLDRRDEAVQWYAAAVRTEPMRWNDPANLPALLPDWNAADRAKLAEVAAAWRAAPPGWP